jgi:Glycosyl hydrolase family 79 C-terminal beta domain
MGRVWQEIRFRWALAVAAVLALAAIVVSMAGTTAGDPPDPRADASVKVGAQTAGRPIAPGYVGLSLEFNAVLPYTGSTPGAVDPVFAELVRNLAPGQAPVLRIGGDSTDSTWWPVAGVSRPRGVSYTLSPLWLENTRTLAQELGAHLILGVNLEANQPALAQAEANAFLNAFGSSVQALEIGNEPNAYPSFPYYHSAPRDPEFSRSKRYEFRDFAADFSRFRKALPSVALAGPTVGGFEWLARLRSFLQAEPTVRVATFHRYPLNRCFTEPGSPTYPTLANLLSPDSSRGLVAGLRPYVTIAHRAGASFRIDEMQSVACGGKRGLSDTFAAALWSLDAVFSAVQQGADGVNFHTFPGARYQLFSFSRTSGSATVHPEYYGLALFAQAAPPGSRMLRRHLSGPESVRAWATRGRDGRLRVLLINDDPARSHVVAVSVPGARPGGSPGVASVERLRAPSALATSGVTLGGRQFSGRTGRLSGLSRVSALPAGRGGRYTVTLPGASAALVTVPRGG